MMMTPQQLMAFSAPCREGIQCYDERYIRFFDNGPYRIGICLTLNIGLE